MDICTHPSPRISAMSAALPASAIRKLVPLSDAAEAAGTEVFHLNIGAPDIASPACALEAVASSRPHHVSYCNSAGTMPLRKGLCEKYYRSIGLDVDPSELIVTVGGSEALSLALQVCCDRGDEVVVMEPFYTNYNTFAFMAGLTLRAVPTTIEEGFAIPDPSEFEKYITPRTKAILLSNPGNPTGTLYDREGVLRLGEIATRHGLFLISDEVYREFCYTGEPYFSAMEIPGAADNVVLVDSVSKRYNLCGARVGCIVSRNMEVMAAAMKFAQARLCPPIYGQTAALGALDTPPEYFAAVREEYRLRRDTAVRMLNAIPGVLTPTPMGAFYTVARLPVDDAEKFARWMLETFRSGGRTTMVTPARSFYKTAGRGVDEVRVAYVLEVPRLEEAIEVLAEGLLAYPGRTL